MLQSLIPQRAADLIRAPLQPRRCTSWASALTLTCLGLCGGPWQDAIASELLSPSSAFIQAGSGQDIHAGTIGLTWDWGHEWRLGGGTVSGYWEVSLADWSYQSEGGGRSVLGQVGAIPVFRYQPGRAALPWYLEAGVGATFTTRLYETEQKHFSTNFNFGDHVAIGTYFGLQNQHEIALRAEHFSNAGIKHPNPGQNFLQLRYSFHFR